MTVVRWDPFRDFGFAQASTWMPPVTSIDRRSRARADGGLPDMAREDIGITIENFVLTLTGEKILERREAGATPPFNERSTARSAARSRFRRRGRHESLRRVRTACLTALLLREEANLARIP